MVKILDGEFRKNLYKDLVDAGYDKQEAQVIVGKKYYSALGEHVVETLTSLLEDARNERYDVGKVVQDLPDQFGELTKMRDFLAPFKTQAKEE